MAWAGQQFAPYCWSSWLTTMTTSTVFAVGEKPMNRLLLPERLLGSGTEPHHVGIVDGFGRHLDGGAVFVPHMGDHVAGPVRLGNPLSVLQMYGIWACMYARQATGPCGPDSGKNE